MLSVSGEDKLLTLVRFSTDGGCTVCRLFRASRSMTSTFEGTFWAEAELSMTLHTGKSIENNILDSGSKVQVDFCRQELDRA
jgi:hypothetical protein